MKAWKRYHWTSKNAHIYNHTRSWRVRKKYQRRMSELLMALPVFKGKSMSLSEFGW